MEAEGVYQLGPDTVSEEMIAIAKKVLGNSVGDEHFKLCEQILELTKKTYRLGAFNMEHKDGLICEAEDQGGWPACANPAEFYILDQFLHDVKRRVFCSEHHDNRFYSPRHMAPIYENPGASWCKYCKARIEKQYNCCKRCADERGP